MGNWRKGWMIGMGEDGGVARCGNLILRLHWPLLAGRKYFGSMSYTSKHLGFTFRMPERRHQRLIMDLIFYHAPLS